MGEVVRWGFWGLGHVARLVAADLRLVPGAVLEAVAARTAEQAERFAREHGAARSYAGFDALLADPLIDAVYIATPPDRHAADSLAAIASGKAVLCEKPFALDAREAETLAAAAATRGVFCMEAMWTRFIPAVVAAKAAVDRGELGAIRLVTGDFAYPVDRGSAPRLFDRSSGGGALLDRGIYLVSLAQHLLGAPSHVQALACGGDGVDEQGSYQLLYPGGALATFSASLQVRGGNAFAIHGERASLTLHDPFYRAHRTTLEPARRAPSTAPSPQVAAASGALSTPSWRSSAAVLAWLRRLDPLVRRLRGRRVQTSNFPGNGYQFELIEATRCIAQGRRESAVMPLADSVAVMKILDSLHDAAERAARCGVSP